MPEVQLNRYAKADVGICGLQQWQWRGTIVLPPRLRQFRVQLSQVTVRGRERGHTSMVKYIGFSLLVLLLTDCGGRPEAGEEAIDKAF